MNKTAEDQKMETESIKKTQIEGNENFRSSNRNNRGKLHQ